MNRTFFSTSERRTGPMERSHRFNTKLSNIIGTTDSVCAFSGITAADTSLLFSCALNISAILAGQRILFNTHVYYAYYVLAKNSTRFDKFNIINQPKKISMFVSRSPCLSVRYGEDDWFWYKLINPLFTNRLLFEIYSWEEKIFNEIKNVFIWMKYFTYKMCELFLK